MVESDTQSDTMNGPFVKILSAEEPYSVPSESTKDSSSGANKLVDVNVLSYCGFLKVYSIVRSSTAFIPTSSHSHSPA